MKNRITIGKRLLIGVLYLSTLIPVSFAQIKGKVIDASNSEALSFANILVLDKEISATYPGVVADLNGDFVLEVPNEKVAVRISFMGYVTKDTVLVSSAFNQIALDGDANLLGEIVVKAKRKLFKMENGGISMDIAGSPLKNIGTANDVLAKQPFIVKDGDGIKVMGKGKPLIYINNRLVRSDNELEKLSSGNIKKVTVITSPGPEYDATVSSVVLIEATRPPGEGMGGELYGRMNLRHKMSADGMVDLNYRKNKLDIFASYWYSESQMKVSTTANREQNIKSGTLTVDNEVNQKTRNRRNYVDGGFNYEFNEKQSLGAKYTFSNVPYFYSSPNMSTKVELNKEPVEAFNTVTAFNLKDDSHLMNAYYTGDVFTWLKAQMNFDYACGNQERRQASVSAREEEANVTTRSLQDYDLYAGKLALTTPLWGSNLQYGVEFSHTTNEQNYLVEEAEGVAGIASDENLSKQKMLAAFVGYSKSFGKWDFNAGLRYEHVALNYFANGVKMDEQSRSYSDLFPTATVSYRGANVQTSLSYRSTTSRPSYSELRNAIQYDDPYTYETGNPFLMPMRKDDISFSALWRDLKFIASYQLYHDLILGVSRPYEDNPDIVIFRPENLDKMQNISASAFYSPTFGFWSPVAGLGVSKDYLSFGNPAQDYNKPYLFYSLQNTFKLPAGFTFMLDVQGNTRGNSSQTYMYDTFQMNVRLTKTCMNGNLILNLRGADILGTYKQKSMTDVYPVKMLLAKNLDTRMVEFSVRYKFNATKTKYKGESASEEERRRM